MTIQSLKGLKVLNTRPKDQAQSLSISINSAGGIAIELPTIEIVDTGGAWIKSLPNLNNVDQAVFISANAVHYCFTQLSEHNIIWPEKIRVIAIGQASAKALHQFNIQVHEIPDTPDSEHLLKLNCFNQLKNQTVLLFKGEGGRKLIEESLLLKGIDLSTVCVYKRVMPKIRQHFINTLWCDNLVDIIVLTSEQSINNLFKMFQKEAHSWLKQKPSIVISQRLAVSARLFGINKIIVCHPEQMMNTLFHYYQGLIHGK